VGPTRARELRLRGINTLGDLVEYFPRDYQHERAERPIAELMPDQIQIARGEVIACDYIPSRPRPRFEATLRDPSGKLALVWFHGAYLRGKITPGMILRVQGRVKFFRNLPQIAQAKWEIIEPDAGLVGEDVLRAVYPATAKLSSLAIWQTIDRNIDAALPGIGEWYPDAHLRARGLLRRPQAYRAIHQPTSWKEALAARQRLVYDELMLMQIGLALGRRLRAGRLTAPRLLVDKLLDERIRRRFPFSLTAAQQRCVLEILADLKASRPMSRLLQGDVGSGKTIVALYGMLVAVANRMQAALLAPTEVLAEQHYLTLTNLLKDSSVHIELFTSRTRRESKGAILRQLSSGRVHLAIGTQALLQEDIEFANLGLVVVDEQHKLGVRQRAQLKSKGLAPHYLVMTATPIPRTLALSYFADFDVSTIDQLPPGRQPISTRWIKPARSAEAYGFIRGQIAEGRQAYVVVPQIEDDGLDESRSVSKVYDELGGGPLKGLNLAILHGQMSTAEKQSIMTGFRAGRIDVLIATTVIEVGIDVPNATVMVIESAERFGLSQLHQIRGRVGRGEHPSWCLLIAEAATEDAAERLKALTRTSDGFEIAETDLKLRGPGDFFGTRQHGLPQFKLADITQELQLLHTAKEDALALLAADPNLNQPEHRALRHAVEHYFGESLVLAQVG
jgi:ATP-dependent DNA helicase RecG